MLDLIESVASLIDVRDKDDLEVTLAGVMFEFVEAARLTIWRVTRRDDVVGLHERLRLTTQDASSSHPAQPMGLADATIEEMRPELRAAFSAGCYASGPRDRKGRRRQVFPVVDGADVVGLVEIESAARLSGPQEKLIHGLLRIYRSHLGILESSDTDELTSLSNRRPFEETFRRLTGVKGDVAPTLRAPVVERRVHGNRADLAVVDIDHFKRVNDDFGHPYGDEVLVLLARLMRRCFRETDHLYRFGGEEFVVILPGAEPEAAEATLERFRLAVADFEFPQVGHVTVSIGVTSILEGDTGSDAFGRADEALYVAKRSGRNQLRRFETLITEGSIAMKKRRSEEIEIF